MANRRTNSNIKPFTSMQLEYIRRGDMLTKALEEKILLALGIKKLKFNPKKSVFICGSSGIGKSFVVAQTAEKYDVDLILVGSDTSMSSLALKLATAVYLAEGEEIYIHFDDCNSIFSDRTAISVMKGALDRDRNIFAWNKNMTTQISLHEKGKTAGDKLIVAALRKFQCKNGVGIEIPTDNVTFIITSNHTLTSSNPAPKTPKQRDEAALRSRLEYKDYDLSMEESWGWIASLVLNNKIPSVVSTKTRVATLTVVQKHILLEWMWSNWDRLPDIGMRFVESLAADIINYPDKYSDQWDMRLESKRKSSRK